ncbi:MAG: hypothetical protein Q4C87_10445 [Actinomycetaceae bacterium]|nr:hypothetical protein [Actinomycetaceae bacterium]
MNTTVSLRSLSALAAIGLAAASLSACMPTTVADGCKQLEAEMAPLKEKSKEIFANPANIAEGFDTLLGDMKAVSGKVGNPEVKQAWDEMVTSFEGTRPSFQKLKELTGDPSKALQNADEIQKVAEEVRPHMEKAKVAADKLNELCPGAKDLPSIPSN